MQLLCIWHSISKFEASCLFKDAFKDWFASRDTVEFVEADRDDIRDVLMCDNLNVKEMLICVLDNASDCVLFSEGIDHRPHVRRILDRFPTVPVVIAAPCHIARDFVEELRRSGREVVFVDDSAYSRDVTPEDYVDPLFDALSALYPPARG